MKYEHAIHRLSWIVCLSLCMLALFELAQAEERIVYADLRANCSNKFQYTATVQENAISIDVPITLPDVSAIPIVRLRWQMNEGQTEHIRICAGETADLGAHDGFFYSRFSILDDWAVASDVPPEEASHAIENFVKQKGIEADIRYYAQYATSGMYEINDDFMGSELSYMESREPVNGYEKGMYIVRARQYICGIPIFFNSYFHYSNVGEPSDPCPNALLYYLDDHNYSLEMSTVAVDSILQENAVLVPFEQISDVLKTFIHLGLIVRMDELELGYMIYYEDAVKAETPASDYTMVAIPTWLVYGEFSDFTYFGENSSSISKQLLNSESDEQLIQQKERIVWGNDCLRIDALTGKFIDMWADPAPRRYQLAEVEP